MMAAANTTVDALRNAISTCVARAAEDAPVDRDSRLAAFVARLSGAVQCLGDLELEAELWGLLDLGPYRPFNDGTRAGALLAEGA